MTLTSTCSNQPIGADEEQETLAGKVVIAKSRREDVVGRNLGSKVHRLSQAHGIREVLCYSAMVCERGTNTQPIEITRYEEERVEMSG